MKKVFLLFLFTCGITFGNEINSDLAVLKPIDTQASQIEHAQSIILNTHEKLQLMDCGSQALGLYLFLRDQGYPVPTANGAANQYYAFCMALMQ